MTTPTLPTYVSIMANGFAVSRQAAVLRTDMDAGPPKQSRVLSRVLLVRSVRLLLTSKADYASFITWFTSDLNRGAEWFNWTDPADGTTKLARIVGGILAEERPTSPGMATWEIACNFETWDA